MAAINRQRLHEQRLTGNPLRTPEAVVGWLGAVQAQEYGGAKWALGLRLRLATDALIDQAFNEGRILRTHVLRPTWHFVAPDDIRWMQALTSPRVNAASAYMYRLHELDDQLFAASNEIVAGALRGGHRLTREELSAALERGGIPATGNRLAYLIMRAELDAVICSGPRRGKQFTYMLLEERAPNGKFLERDEALAELARRYFTGHGPATVQDFAWWSGLSIADVKRGIGLAGKALESKEIADTGYWFSPELSPAEPQNDSALLLPTYDEFFMGFTGSSRPGGQDARELLFDSTIVLDGSIAGTWRRTLEKGSVLVEVKTLAPLSASDERVKVAVDRFAAFLELPAVLKAVDESNLKSLGWRRSRLASLEARQSGE